ncbi:MAG: DUF2950 family protein [Pseudomonadota bacterium]
MARSTITGVAMGLALFGGSATAEPAVYATPQDALEAMVAALQAEDRGGVLTVFGPQAETIISEGDPVEDAANRTAILALYGEGYRFVPGDDGEVVIALGAEGWPFPIPVARGEAGWSFDLVAGEAEILSRQIGGNELDVIDLMHAYVDVQAAFRLVDHDGDGVMEFARQIISTPEDRNGLFWAAPGSPVGALLARASATGFSDGEVDHAPEPHLGYFYRILEAQGNAAPGGALDYIVGDNMVVGHALLAVPAAYGETGVHSFLVGENGIVYEADLGEDSLSIAAAISTYDPSAPWQEVP